MRAPNATRTGSAGLPLFATNSFEYFSSTACQGIKLARITHRLSAFRLPPNTMSNLSNSGVCVGILYIFRLPSARLFHAFLQFPCTFLVHYTIYSFVWFDFITFSGAPKWRGLCRERSEPAQTVTQGESG